MALPLKNPPPIYITPCLTTRCKTHLGKGVPPTPRTIEKLPILPNGNTPGLPAAAGVRVLHTPRGDFPVDSGTVVPGSSPSSSSSSKERLGLRRIVRKFARERRFEDSRILDQHGGDMLDLTEALAERLGPLRGRSSLVLTKRMSKTLAAFPFSSTAELSTDDLGENSLLPVRYMYESLVFLRKTGLVWRRKGPSNPRLWSRADRGILRGEPRRDLRRFHRYLKSMNPEKPYRY